MAPWSPARLTLAPWSGPTTNGSIGRSHSDSGDLSFVERESTITASRTANAKSVRFMGVSFDPEVQLIPTVIQFSAPQYLCMEDHGQVTVRVMRIGDLNKKCLAEYTTLDGTARAGHKYEATEGTLVFLPGESTKDILIHLLQDDRWDATLEFQVVLTRVTDAQIGLYLNACRIKIIDDDSFPTNKWKSVYGDTHPPHPYSKEYQEGVGPKLRGTKLMFEFVKLNLADSKNRWNTLRYLMFDCVKGVYFFLTLFLVTYLIDGVFTVEASTLVQVLHDATSTTSSHLDNQTETETVTSEEQTEHVSSHHPSGLIPANLIIDGKRRETAMVIAALYIVPFCFVHFADYSKGFLEIPYRPRLTTQANLLAKFLNYKETKRANINVGEILMTMQRDAIEVCEMGFMKIVSVTGIILKLCFAVVFILSESPYAIVPLVTYPIVLGFFLYMRENLTIQVSEERAKREDEVVQAVSTSVSNYRLIADFSLRSRAVRAYERAIERLHQQMILMRAVVTNNMYMAPWLTTFLVGGWMIYGAFQVEGVGGTLTIGQWVSTMNVFKEVGMEMMEVYIEAMEIQRSFGPLEKICYYMNLETDLMDRLKVAQDLAMEAGEGITLEVGEEEVAADGHGHGNGNGGGAKAEGANGNGARPDRSEEHDREAEDDNSRPWLKRSRSALECGDNHPDFAADRIPIILKDLSYEFSNGVEVLHKLNASFDQGGLYALVGEPHQGKGTVLKLLGQVLLPQPGRGQILIPSHLRILHVAAHSECLMDDNFLENVKLYTPLDQDEVHTTERVNAICRMVGLRDQLLDLLRDRKQLSWRGQLTHTDFARLNLARALIQNPECLVIHKPDMVFTTDEVATVMILLRRHVNERGLCMPAESRRLRRPRTVFFTCTTPAAMNIADRIWTVSRTAITLLQRPLRVRVVSAMGLKSKSDPYCVCELARKPKSRFRTFHSPVHTKPVWNFESIICDAADDDMILFSIMDQDITKLEVPGVRLGFASFPVKDLLATGFWGELRLLEVDPESQAYLKVEINRLEATTSVAQRNSTSNSITEVLSANSL